MAELDLPRYLRVRAKRADADYDHISAQVYDESAGMIEKLEAENKRLQAIVDKPVRQHPLDEAVDAFATKMKDKLENKRHQGWSGWDHGWFITDKRCCNRKLASHVKRVLAGDWKQAVDVANFALFIDHFYSTREAAEAARKDTP